MTYVKTTLTVILLSVAAAPAMAHHRNGGIADRIEDRIDRRESIIDERVTHGPLDRIEDVIDRRESYRDRHGLRTPPALNRAERRSWRRIWHRNH